MAKITSHQAATDAEEEEYPLDVHGLLLALLRRSWLIALVAVLTGFMAWSYARKLPVLYQSAAVIQIQPDEHRPIDLRDDSQSELLDPEVIETFIQRLHSRSLMERVNKALGLATDVHFLGFKPSYPASDDLVVAILLSGSNAELRPHSRLIDVSFIHKDPEIVYKVTDAIVNQFLQQDSEQRAETLEAQNRLLVQKSQELKDKVTHSELDLQQYKKQIGSVSLEERRNLFEEKLKGLNTDLIAAKGERLRLESDAQQAKMAGDSTDRLLAILSVEQDPQVVAARERLSKEEENISALAERYGPLHPRMIEEQAQLEAARQALSGSVRTAPDRIESQYVAARAREDGLQRAAQEQEAALLDMDAKVIPFRALQREYDSNNTLFESVLQRLKESTLQLGVQSVDFRVVEPAIAARPVPSRRSLLVLVGALFGGGLVGGIVVLLYFTKQSISSVESAERGLGLPVLTAVPKMRAGSKDIVSAMDRPGSLEAESFRTLRTALQFIRSDSKLVILITSAVPAEGKSVTAGNLAVAFARLGLRTLLVEADLRRPSLNSLLLSPGQATTGLGDYLMGKPINIMASKQENLAFLSAGNLLENPAEMLASPLFGQLMEQVKSDYERIVVDTAPINVVSDTLNIVGSAAIVCLVVRSNSTPRRLVQRAVELLRRSGVRPDGLILNCVDAWAGHKYQDYYGSTGDGESNTSYPEPDAHAPASLSPQT